jgi:hypothetical protein
VGLGDGVPAGVVAEGVLSEVVFKIPTIVI